MHEILIEGTNPAVYRSGGTLAALSTHMDLTGRGEKLGLTSKPGTVPEDPPRKNLLRQFTSLYNPHKQHALCCEKK
jgi:hypothetical protein